jgi:hypothetical protein
MPKINLEEEDLKKLFEAVNEGYEPPGELIGKLFPSPKLSDSFINLWYLVGAALCGRPVWEPTEGLPYEIFNLR